MPLEAWAQSVVDEWFPPEEASAPFEPEPEPKPQPESTDADDPWADSWERADDRSPATSEAGESTFEQQQEWLHAQEEPQPFESFAELDAAFEQASPEEQRAFLAALTPEQMAELVAAYNAEMVDSWVNPRLEAIRAQTQAEAAQAGYAREAEAQADLQGERRVNAILASCHLPRDVDPVQVRMHADEMYVYLVSQGRDESPELAEEVLRDAAKAAADVAEWQSIWKRSSRR